MDINFWDIAIVSSIVLFVIGLIVTSRADKALDENPVLRVFTLVWNKVYPNAIFFGFILFAIVMRLLSEDSGWMAEVPDVVWVTLGVIIAVFGRVIDNLTSPSPPPDPLPGLLKQVIEKLDTSSCNKKGN